ncbi:hypothetical protein M0765_000555 [Variovorax sp. S2]|uniref:hypothetical protein n=1 Tax=Variovorax sp. S12S4 TaxID=3029170 RepID=UPI00215C1B88|nr:hypothetical protein [Variovorax sp. S12S4]MCR8956272.1 hypothetical protein [Variovorax sp. S12S4]
MATITDSQLASLEKEARRARWIDRNKHVLMLVVVACFGLAGAVAGMGVGHWLGVQQERAERVTEIQRLQGLLDKAIGRLGPIANQVEEAVETAQQAANTASQAAGKVDDAAVRAGRAADKASTAAAKAGAAASTAHQAARPAPAPAPATLATREVLETNRRLKENRK